MAAVSARQGGGDAVEEDCVYWDGDGVGCATSHLQPVMKRSRGRSACVCVDGARAVAEEADEFVYVKFGNCTEGGGRCWPAANGEV